MKYVFLTLLVILTGCAGTREITKMEDHLTQAELKNPNHETVDKIKQHYFTPEAYEVIKKIPVINGPAVSGYSAGVNFWSNLASFVTCNGVGRKIIIPDSSLEQWGVAVLVHEYVHHLDDIDRDGEGEFIDHEEFKSAYKLLAYDQRWRGLYLWAEQQNDMMVTEVFGVGELSEQIAYVAQHLAIKGGPDYMKHVFRKILKVDYESVYMYTDVNGKHAIIDLKDPDEKED